MRKNKSFAIPVLLFVLLHPLVTYAQVRLPQLIADHMVLQRDVVNPIWGWAAPAEKITLSFNGWKYKTIAAADGSWQVRLPATRAGGPYTLDIRAEGPHSLDIRAGNHIVINDILFGDVWFCSGQSNMVLPMERVKEKYPEEVAQAEFPMIRNFFVPTAADVAGVHEDLPPSKWVEATPKNVLAFGAATWFFAKALYLKYHIPIGIINSSVGGMPIQAWISAAGLKDLSVYADRVARFRDSTYLDSLLRSSAVRTVPEPPPHRPDLGLAGPVKWYDSNYVPSGWHKFWLPGFWADQGVKGLNGVVWFRKEIEVPPSMAGKPAKLFIGRIIDADETYVNGVKVGNITYQYPPRRYDVPAGLLKAGKNILTVRVTNTSGKGGFEPDKRYELTDGITHIDIRGDWQYKVGQVFPARNRVADGVSSFNPQNEPTGLYNTMVAPATNARIKGFLWYQGEANTGDPKDYRRLLPALIADWRNQWRQGELPFLYVQLPNFMEVQYSPSESQWAELREAQLRALSVPGTAMVVTIDVGEWNDLHPLDKKDVGERLALAARHLAYGEDTLVFSGPIYRSARVDGNKIIVRFTNTGSGLLVKGGGELGGFAIAGADRKFVWAEARVEGDSVIVFSDEVDNPLYVRYAWADNPESANLYNVEGLPASPFSTDDQYAPPVTYTAEQDHADMMKQLGIVTLRAGPSGDEKAVNHANYDEALANPYPNLPDVLVLKNGKKVTKSAQWWNQRRPELVEDFGREVYGRVPAGVPRVNWTVKATDRELVGGTPVISKQLVGQVDNSAYPLIDVNIRMTLVLPANATAPVPLLMLFARTVSPTPVPAAPGVGTVSAGSGPARGAGDPPTAEQLIADGWGYILIDPNSIQADNGAGITRGIIGLVNKGQPRKPDDWGALRAWAWGAARALDYLEASEPMVDTKHVGIEGVSRYGKAALVTLAFEPRFAMGLIGSSGEGGAKLLRRNFGEAVESLTGGEYYWMAGNFMKYGASEAVFGSKTAGDLPVDAHELIALCAPRLVFISYGVPGQGDAKWLDQQGSYMAAVAAGPVFQLLGARGLGVSGDYHSEKMPPVNTGLLDGQLAWRQHDGGHTDAPNVKYFIQWADKFMGRPAK